MAVPAPAIPFFLRLTDGRVWGGAEFPGGFVCVYHRGEANICSVAVTLADLLDVPEDSPLHGATVEHY